MKNTTPIHHGMSRRFRLYFAWPLIIGILLALLNVFIFMIDKDSGFVLSIFLVFYAIVAAMIYGFGRFGLKTELVRYAMGFSKTDKARLKEMDVPYLIIDGKGYVHWSNDAFFDIVNHSNVEKKLIFDVLPELPVSAIDFDGFDKVSELTRGDKKYRVVLKKTMNEEMIERSGAGEDLGNTISLFFYDVTEISALTKEIKDKQMILGLVYIDNYEEALESIDEVRRSLLSALVDRKITKFMQGIDAVIRKLEKDKYIVIFKNQYLEKLKNDKFSLLEDVKNINIGNDMSVTLSIGIGIAAESYTKSYDFARAAIDMALGRGGDQVVIKEKDSIRYFGGKSQHVEKTTRVKARVKAHALSELIEAKDHVLIMGHKMGDVDAVGAAIGVFRICKTFNKRAHIVIDDISTSVAPIIERVRATADSGDTDIFVRGEKALTMVDSDTMLVVVDVNRRSYVECEGLLDKVGTIVLLDHHRQGSDVIDNAVLSYIEPYASSSCEMVAEILQYIDADVKIKQAEADAMYSGIMIDTNNFLTKTGVRTFEAAAYLRRNGADVTRIRKAFRTEMDDFMFKAKVTSTAHVYRERFAFAECRESDAKSPTILGAQVANELMNISNVKASFVFTLFNKKIYISARSIDELNVQVVMEKLGGGGHMSVAGAQLEGITIEEAEGMVKAVLDKMIEVGDITL